MKNQYDELVADLSTQPQASDPKTWSQSLAEAQGGGEEEDPLMAILNDPAVAEAMAAFEDEEEPEA